MSPTSKYGPDRDAHAMSVALTARLSDNAEARPLSPKQYWQLVEASGGVPTGAGGLRDPQIRSLAQRTTQAALHMSECEHQSIVVLTPFHASYPSALLARLGSQAPPLLYAAGDLGLLSHDAERLGVVGSRDASDEAMAAARAAVEIAAQAGWQVISGGAKGVDAIALNAAVDIGAGAIAVLPEGVRRAARKPGLRRILRSPGVLVLSMVHPDAAFSVGTAMARNKLIYALAKRTLVVAASEGSGGTWSGATEALRRGYGEVVALLDSTDLPVGPLAKEGAHTLQDIAGLVATSTQGGSGDESAIGPHQPQLF